MLIGIVSDTHGYFDPRLPGALEGVQAIVHAGDVGAAAVLQQLAALAPVFAVRGNNDAPAGGLGLPLRLDVVLDGLAIHVVHELRDAEPAAGTAVLVYGHSHRPLIERRNGLLVINPGAAGRRGFHRTLGVALLDTSPAQPQARLVELGPRLGRSGRGRVSG